MLSQSFVKQAIVSVVLNSGVNMMNTLYLNTPHRHVNGNKFEPKNK